MKRSKTIQIAFLAIVLAITFSCCEEASFVPEYKNPEDNFVLVQGGSYEMGDWLRPFYLDEEVSEGVNIKDVTTTGRHGLDFTFDARFPHTVTVNSFYMSKCEVTFDEFDRYSYEMEGPLHEDGFEGDADSPPKSWGRGDGAALYISWIDAVRYCNWLSIKEGLDECYEIMGATTVRWNTNKNGYRLPTEAEWEYAARGGHLMSSINDGKGHLYAGCNDIPGSATASVPEIGVVDTDLYTSVEEAEGFYTTLRDYSWCNLTSGWKNMDALKDDNGQAYPVGLKEPNALGFYDMSGNVWEWCWDFYSDTYYQYCIANPSESDNPIGPEDENDKGANSCHVLRGGSWGNYPVFVRTTFRFFSRNQVLTNYTNPSFMYSSWRSGFRLVRNAE